MSKPAQNRSRRAVPAAPATSESPGPGQQKSPQWDRRTWLLAIPLALLAMLAFIPAVNNDFVNWDDHDNFLNNPYYRGLGAAQVKWAWSTFWLGVYQPLAWLLFEAQYAFWKLDPHGYHLTSLVLHAANVVVLYVLTVTLLVRCRPDPFLKSPWTCASGAALATALFAVHPLRVEAVAWVSCQPYLPCALWSMLAVLAYLGAFPTGSSPRRGWLAVSFLLFVAALLFKAVAVSLPVVLLILDVYPLRRLGDSPRQWFGPATWRVWLEKVPFVILSLVFAALAVAAKPHAPLPVERHAGTAAIAQACYATWFYIVKTALPLDLIPLYTFPTKVNWLAPSFLSSILGILALCAGLFLLRRRWPGLLAAWLSYLVILAPNSGLVTISNQFAADRYSYVAMLGLVMLAAAGLCRLWEIASRRRPGAILMITLSLGALSGLVLLTWHQCRIWRTSETLWTHALHHGAGRSSQAHTSLGAAQFVQGKLAEAEAHFLEAIRLDPDYDRPHNNLGFLRFRQGKLVEAEAHFHQAIRIYPGSSLAHNNMGLLRFRQGKMIEAEAHYRQAIELDPSFAQARRNLGTLFLGQGKLVEAEALFHQAIRLKPGDAESFNNLGTIFFRRGEFGEAEAHYRQAIRIDPGAAGAHGNLGFLCCRQGKFDEAAVHYNDAFRLNSDDAELLNNRAMMLAACPLANYRDGKKAVEFATRACKLTEWKQPDFLDTLAAAYAEAGDFDSAVRWQAKAIEFLMDKRDKEKEDFHSRLVLYQAKKPYRETLPGPAQAPILSHTKTAG